MCQQSYVPSRSSRGKSISLPFPFCGACSQASQVAQMVKNLPVNAQDIGDVAQSLGQEDPLEEGMATHSSVLAWEIS